MICHINYKIYNKYRYETRSQYFHFDDFIPGNYIGLRFCTDKYDYGDYGGWSSSYTAYEVFKIRDKKTGTFNLLKMNTVDEVILESSDQQLFSLTCTAKNGRTETFDGYKEYDWALEEKAVEWVENDLHVSIAYPEMDIKFYKTATEVKNALQEKEEYRAEMYQKKQEEAKLNAEKERQNRIRQEEAKRNERQAASQLDDLFYTNRSSASDSGSVIIQCSGCGQKIRLPIRTKTLVYTCPKCGRKGEYTHRY